MENKAKEHLQKLQKSEVHEVIAKFITKVRREGDKHLEILFLLDDISLKIYEKYRIKKGFLQAQTEAIRTVLAIAYGNNDTQEENGKTIKVGHISVMEEVLKANPDVVILGSSDTPEVPQFPKELITLGIKRADIVPIAIQVKEPNKKGYKGHEQKYKYHK